MKNMKSRLFLTAIFFMAVLCVSVAPAFAAKPSDSGFDEFGYNYQARVFVGRADGVDRNLDGTVWGDPTYANDWLVMKWSKAWDDARFGSAEWNPDAWCTNEWNGMLLGGSGTGTEHYKIIWVGPLLEGSPYWRPGGYAIWGEFEVIMDVYTEVGAHYNFHVTPAGLGAGLG